MESIYYFVLGCVFLLRWVFIDVARESEIKRDIHVEGLQDIYLKYI